MMTYEIEVLPFEMAICRLGPDDGAPDWALGAEFFSLTRTGDELSVVCPQDQVPPGIEKSAEWRCLKLRGPLDFNQVGVLASLTGPLASEGISVFAISTYGTDYILVQRKGIDRAVSVLRKQGHVVQH
jgi:uncharacterized protein